MAAAQFVPLADSALSGALVHIPSDIYDLDPDWEIDPDSLELMGKLGAPQMSRRLYNWTSTMGCVRVGSSCACRALSTSSCAGLVAFSSLSQKLKGKLQAVATWLSCRACERLWQCEEVRKVHIVIGERVWACVLSCEHESARTLMCGLGNQSGARAQARASSASCTRRCGTARPSRPRS